MRASLEGSLSAEVAMIVLDVVCLYTNTFKVGDYSLPHRINYQTVFLQEQLEFREGDNCIMNKIFDLYLGFLSSNQSEAVQKHAFAALRSFINKFPRPLFLGEANMCAHLCYAVSYTE